jgi:hypothetical protein
MIKYFALSSQRTFTFDTGFVVLDESGEKYYFESQELARKIMDENEFRDLFSEQEEDRIKFNEEY